MTETEFEKVKQLLLILLEATEMEGIKQWALQVTFQYCLERFPETNSTELWTRIKGVYTKNLFVSFPDQEEPGQSYRRASGDANSRAATSSPSSVVPSGPSSANN